MVKLKKELQKLIKEKKIRKEKLLPSIKNAYLLIENDTIVDFGDMSDATGIIADQTIDAKGKLVLPTWCDSHTHIVYAGNREGEFVDRINGLGYQEIAKKGGGILNSAKTLQETPEEEVYKQSAKRLEEVLKLGTGSVEIKSGYGLKLDDELKMLRVARQLGENYPVDVITTFLGAHALPSEYAGRSDAYIDLVCEEILPAVAAENLANHVDAFCEGIAFSPDQVAKVFEVAQHLGLPTKLHAEQLSDLKGAVMAAKNHALSVDHLEYLADEDVPVLAANNTVAVLLPGAFYYLRETKLPPIEALRKHQGPIALATDSNPGSSPITSLTLVMNMACPVVKMTPEEALAGVTRNAAQALGIQNKQGILAVGNRANLVLWNAADPAELSYRIGGLSCKKVMFNGKLRKD